MEIEICSGPLYFVEESSDPDRAGEKIFRGSGLFKDHDGSVFWWPKLLGKSSLTYCLFKEPFRCAFPLNLEYVSPDRCNSKCYVQLFGLDDVRLVSGYSRLNGHIVIASGFLDQPGKETIKVDALTHEIVAGAKEEDLISL